MEKKPEYAAIDIETLGTRSDAIITSIGVQPFYADGTLSESTFYIKIDFFSSYYDYGRNFSIDTLNFWCKQNRDLCQHQFDNSPHDLQDALVRLSEFLRFKCAEGVTVLGKGPNFDMRILVNAYEQFEELVPWKHYHENDVRTYITISKILGLPDIEFDGHKHHAFDDARHEAKEVCQVLKEIHKLKQLRDAKDNGLQMGGEDKQAIGNTANFLTGQGDLSLEVYSDTDDQQPKLKPTYDQYFLGGVFSKVEYAVARPEGCGHRIVLIGEDKWLDAAKIRIDHCMERGELVEMYQLPVTMIYAYSDLDWHELKSVHPDLIVGEIQLIQVVNA